MYKADLGFRSGKGDSHTRSTPVTGHHHMNSVVSGTLLTSCYPYLSSSSCSLVPHDRFGSSLANGRPIIVVTITEPARDRKDGPQRVQRAGATALTHFFGLTAELHFNKCHGELAVLARSASSLTAGLKEPWATGGIPKQSQNSSFPSVTEAPEA